jgi:hypothetical protein
MMTYDEALTEAREVWNRAEEFWATNRGKSYAGLSRFKALISEQVVAGVSMNDWVRDLNLPLDYLSGALTPEAKAASPEVQELLRDMEEAFREKQEFKAVMRHLVEETGSVGAAVDALFTEEGVGGESRNESSRPGH